MTVLEYYLLKKEETNGVELSKLHVHKQIECEFAPSVANTSTWAIFNTFFRSAFGGQFDMPGSSVS